MRELAISLGVSPKFCILYFEWLSDLFNWHIFFCTL